MTDTIDVRLLGTDGSFDVSGTWLAYWLVILRLVAGWWMLHAGLDKIWAWPFDASWFVGSAEGTVVGPLVGLFADGAMLTFVNFAIPIGQTLIGLGLLLGCLTRTAAFFGAVLMVFFYFINGQTGDWAHGVVTGDLLGLLLFATIGTLGAGRVLGVDAYLVETDVVQNSPKLRYFVG